MEILTKISLAFSQGGIWMWLIFALQVVAMAIVVERIYALYFRRQTGEKGFANEFETFIRKGQLDQVSALTESSQRPLARVIEAGTRAAMNFGGREEIQGKMDEVLLEENAHIEKRTNFLAMLANVGTLAGLLGTIVGMIKSFAAVTFASPMEKATLLASGISEAMNTTAYGLIMAIPTLIMFAILTNRANQLEEDLNQGALKVFNWLSYAYEPIPLKSKRGPQA